MARLAAALALPEGIPAERWAALAVASARLLRSYGAELHCCAPGVNPAGRRMAWLLGDAGEVLDVAPRMVRMRRRPSGARLAYRRLDAAARAGMVPAWALDGS